MNILAIVGGGSWGTALAIALSPKFPTVRLLVHDPDLARTMDATRENAAYLPGFPLPQNVAVSQGLDVGDADLVLGVMPSRFARQVYLQLRLPDGVPVVSATKGLERRTLLRMSQVIAETKPGHPVAVLSGPTFAREIAQGNPAAVVIASIDTSLAAAVQTAFSGPALRFYTNSDVTGVETGASLKNVIAIGAGVVDGLHLGSNSKAALITRGLAEITRLAVAAGGQAATLAGLAGLGDLVLTCTGDLSRNRQVGLDLAEGKGVQEIQASTRMIAEGIETTEAAMGLADRLNVEVPITAQLSRLLQGKCSPIEAVRNLMDRSPKGE